MQAIYTCLRDTHDHYLLLLAATVCIMGVYASFAVASHASRQEGGARALWLTISVSAAGCTAWSTHMIALLAFKPGMPSGFDPAITVVSLVFTIAGIGLAISLAFGSRDRAHRFGAGLLLGATITVLHYLGQSAYLVTGSITWNLELVVVSTAVSLPFFGIAMTLSGERRRALRLFATPLLAIAIALLHFGGMAALQLEFDPRIELPAASLSTDVVAPIVALVSAALVILAFIGLRFALNARAQVLRDQVRLEQLADLAVGSSVPGNRSERTIRCDKPLG
jgi:NO-binding membrane sensor protein with MHYT domain